MIIMIMIRIIVIIKQNNIYIKAFLKKLLKIP